MILPPYIKKTLNNFEKIRVVFETYLIDYDMNNKTQFYFIAPDSETGALKKNDFSAVAFANQNMFFPIIMNNAINKMNKIKLRDRMLSYFSEQEKYEFLTEKYVAITFIKEDKSLFNFQIGIDTQTLERITQTEILFNLIDEFENLINIKTEKEITSEEKNYISNFKNVRSLMCEGIKYINFTPVAEKYSEQIPMKFHLAFEVLNDKDFICSSQAPFEEILNFLENDKELFTEVKEMLNKENDSFKISNDLKRDKGTEGQQQTNIPIPKPKNQNNKKPKSGKKR